MHASFLVRLNSEHAVFRAHFPGEPILPGACIVQMVQDLYETWSHRQAEIAQVSNLKFLTVITPAEVTELEVMLEVKKEEAGITHLKADIVKGDTTYAKMTLQEKSKTWISAKN